MPLHSNTAVIAPMHVQLATSGCEAMVLSGRRTSDCIGGEPGPGLVGGVEGVQVVEVGWQQEWGSRMGRAAGGGPRPGRTDPIGIY
jgi:hypothetical protein